MWLKQMFVLEPLMVHLYFAIFYIYKEINSNKVQLYQDCFFHFSHNTPPWLVCSRQKISSNGFRNKKNAPFHI